MRLTQSKGIGFLIFCSTMLLLGGCLTASDGLTPDDSGLGVGPVNNAAPTISGNPSPAITIGQFYTFIPSASDPDGDALTFSIENQPSWASFDTSTGELSGQPTLGAEQTYSGVLISVSDGALSASLPNFDITVTQSSLGSTTVTLTAPAQNTDGSPFMDLAAYKLYFGMSAGEYPNEIYIDSPGISSYVIENLAPSTYFFVATAINQSSIESGFSNEISRVVE